MSVVFPGILSYAKGWEVLTEKLFVENCSRPVPSPRMVRRGIR